MSNKRDLETLADLDPAGKRQLETLADDDVGPEAYPIAAPPRLREELAARDFELRERVGAGAMGEVYRVHHRTWQLDLAMKTPRPSALSHPGGRAAFVLELEAWTAIGLHPHIVSCFFVLDIDNAPRAFIEYVEGGDLAARIARGRLSERELVDLAIQLAWGLSYAHRHELVHGDVKPHNALLDDGHLKLTDFGLARFAERAGAGGGTPAYRSPEQAAGAPRQKASDVWSWAASVLHMLVGEVTWTDGSLCREALLACSAGSERLRAILIAALDEDPATRASIDEVLRELLSLFEARFGSYARKLPDESALRVDGLNNRAISLLHLDKDVERAIGMLREARAKDPAHAETTFNIGLIDWRAGRLTDEELRTRVRDKHREWVDQERGELALEARKTGAPIEGLAALDDALVVVKGGRAIKRGSKTLFKLDKTSALAVRGARVLAGAAFGELVDYATNARRTDIGEGVRAIAPFANNNMLVATGTEILVVDSAPTLRFPIAGVSAMASAGSRFVVAAGLALRVFDQRGEALSQARGFDARVTALALDERGAFFSAHEDRALRFWSPSGQCLFTARTDDDVRALRANSDGVEFVLRDGRRFFARHTPGPRAAFDIVRPQNPRALADTSARAQSEKARFDRAFLAGELEAARRALASLEAEGDYSESRERRRQLSARMSRGAVTRALVAARHAALTRVNAICYDDDDGLVAASDTGALLYWSPRDGVRELSVDDNPLTCVAVRGARAAVGSSRGRAFVVENHDVRLLGQHANAVRAVALGASGDVLVGDADGGAVLYSTRSRRLKKHKGWCRAAALGQVRALTSFSDDVIAEHDLTRDTLFRTPKLTTRRLAGGLLRAIALSDDEERVAALSDRALHLKRADGDWTSRELRARFMATTPNGDLVVCASVNGELTFVTDEDTTTLSTQLSVRGLAVDALGLNACLLCEDGRGVFIEMWRALG